MTQMNRREALAAAAACGASLVWASGPARASTIPWRERRDVFPQGVASGDPAPDGAILWTRRPPASDGKASARLTVEIAEDEAFTRVVATRQARISADLNWTCRVMASGLKPAHVYFYRFTDETGSGSRVGRTITAPATNSDAPVRFAFASCQNQNVGYNNAYKRMIFEDRARPPAEQLGFVLHLGDFVYELVWYPEDRKQGYFSRKIRDIVRFPTGEKIADFHVPVDLADYRALYQGYLADEDLQDARARWPFVCIWDNHEFSWQGWQSWQRFGPSVRFAPSRKVAACQAWFEFQPARVVKAGGDRSLDRFTAPVVKDAVVPKGAEVGPVDAVGLGTDPSNLAAIGSLTLYRALRFGKNVELILTDNRSYRCEGVLNGNMADAFFPAKGFPAAPQELVEIFDAGRAYEGGPPATLVTNDGKTLPNPRKDGEPQTMLGAVQKRWFLDRLARSDARWKVWGNSIGMLEERMDPQNLPAGMTEPWAGKGFGVLRTDDWAGFFHERGEILDHLKARGVTGVASLAGDRHAFFAGRVAKHLPPGKFEPVMLEFVGAGISSSGAGEGEPYSIKKTNPLRPLYLLDRPDGAPPLPMHNFTVMHGVKAALTLSKTGDMKAALAEHNPDLSPHLSFLDLGGYGYGVVTVGAKEMEVEFVCIPTPREPAATPDGGPLAYRVRHTAALWKPGQAPVLKQQIVEGEPPLAI